MATDSMLSQVNEDTVESINSDAVVSSDNSVTPESASFEAAGSGRIAGFPADHAERISKAFEDFKANHPMIAEGAASAKRAADEVADLLGIENDMVSVSIIAPYVIAGITIDAINNHSTSSYVRGESPNDFHSYEHNPLRRPE